jgi:hypothetical protein
MPLREIPGPHLPTSRENSNSKWKNIMGSAAWTRPTPKTVGLAGLFEPDLEFGFWCFIRVLGLEFKAFDNSLNFTKISEAGVLVMEISGKLSHQWTDCPVAARSSAAIRVPSRQEFGGLSLRKLAEAWKC